MSTIVIDPGHGGFDVGAVSGTRFEKDDNLRLALAVRQRLLEQGQDVVMTRESDVFVSLPERSAISNAADADIFVSLHRNSSSDPMANGVENWVYLNAPMTTVAYAREVLNAVVEAGVQSNRGVMFGNFAVLRETAAPAMLLEMGFMSNEVDNQLFDENFDAYAEAITRGILEALGEPYIPPGEGDATIRGIQATLNSRYGMGLEVTGVYDRPTRVALVMALQRELNVRYGAGLAVDGIFGPQTRAAVRNVSSGASGNIVYILQAALYGNGYNITVDGIFGPNTEQALRNFQRDNGLSADGIAGPATFERLLAG